MNTGELSNENNRFTAFFKAFTSNGKQCQKKYETFTNKLCLCPIHYGVPPKWTWVFHTYMYKRWLLFMGLEYKNENKRAW